MSTITIDTQGNELLKRQAERDGLRFHRDECAEGEDGHAIWNLNPESRGMQINFDPKLFNATLLADGVVIIERNS
jgi:hypothetical protein